MPQNPISYLRTQAIRMLRVDFGSDARKLSEEIFTILSNLQPFELGPITFNVPGGDPNDPFTIDLPPDFQIPNIDWNFPSQQPPLPEPETNGDLTTETEYFWSRLTIPGRIESGSGPNYSISLRPNGNLIASTTPLFTLDPTRQFPAEVTVTARLTDPSSSADIGSWVMVYRVQEYQVITRTHRNQQGGIVSVSTDINVLQTDHSFNGSAAGGGRIAKTDTEIAGMTGTTPGQGTITFYSVDPETGQLVAGQSGTAYSIVSGKVRKDRFIQVKSIGGRWYVDVEDCGAAEEEPPIQQ